MSLIRKDLNSQRAELYREVLYVAVLDALSNSVMPNRDNNRDRFVYFLKRFCRWPDGERVSLPHLVALVRLNPDPALENLRQWALEKYNKMPVHSGALTQISDDPMVDEVKVKWPASSEHRTPIKGVDLEALTHYRLLYVYRNMLVHELRRPGRGMHFSDSQTPYYHGMSDLDGSGRLAGTTVELVYPWMFLHGLCETALAGLRPYFTANELNPYDSFVFGTYWIRELNS